MSVLTYSMTLDKGSTFRKNFYWLDSLGNPKDLTGFTARMQIRKTVYSPNVVLELTTSNGGIVLSPSEGKITLNILDTDTASLDANSGMYDLELISPSGDVIKLLKGSVIFIDEVTR